MPKHAHVYSHADARPHVRARGRHRRPSTTRPVARTMAAGGLTAGALLAAEAIMPGASAATADDFAKLRMCESGGNYRANTGNGYFGAYQFSLGTWQGLGYSGLPSNASPATQDAAARQLQGRSGWGQWPACSAQLGLGSNSSSSAVSTPTVIAAVSSNATIVHVPEVAAIVLSTDDVDTWNSDVLALQKKLFQRGYHIERDGHFGTETESAVLAFQATHGLEVDGVAGPKTLGMIG